MEAALFHFSLECDPAHGHGDTDADRHNDRPPPNTVHQFPPPTPGTRLLTNQLRQARYNVARPNAATTIATMNHLGKGRGKLEGL